MKQANTAEYRFQSYSVWAGIAFLAFLIPLVYGLVALFRALGWTDVNESIFKIIVILLVVGWLLLIRRWITVLSTVQINPNGLIFINLPRMWRFAKTDYFIFWNEIQDWSLTDAQVSAHSFSPMVFEIRLSDRRKIEILVAEESAFKVFMLDFEAKIASYNLKNQAVPPIEPRKHFRFSKALSYGLVSLFFLGMSVLMLGLGIGYIQPEDTSKMERLGFIGMSLFMLLAWGLVIKEIRNRKD